jgi:3-hydroxyacyl-CoA dehydrogenase/enoyl-CoA hydratase/3-hydroxybutyryl-CoA epimerase
MPYLGEALRMLEEGSRIEEIDHALLNFGMPMGAFILLDEIGIDVAHKVSDIVRQGLGERITASPLLATLHQKEFYGKKNGRGFYLYLHGTRGGASPLVAILCLAEGIIDRPDLLDAALVFGIGFPPFRGGLLKYAESLGAKYIVERLDLYTAKYGERFRPPQALFEMSRDDFIGQVVC